MVYIECLVMCPWLFTHPVIDLNYNKGYRLAQHEESPNLGICSRHTIIGNSFNPNIMSEDLSLSSNKELTTADGDLTHEGNQL